MHCQVCNGNDELDWNLCIIIYDCQSKNKSQRDLRLNSNYKNFSYFFVYSANSVARHFSPRTSILKLLLRFMAISDCNIVNAEATFDWTQLNLNVESGDADCRN